MSGMLESDKLKLKPDKQRKAEQAVAEFLKTDTLTVLHQKSVEVATRKKSLMQSGQLEEAKRSLSTLEQQMEPLNARKSNLEADERLKENQLQEVQSRIVNVKKTIQANILESTGKQVQVQ
jgi:seryl-tRNA synthetase